MMKNKLSSMKLKQKIICIVFTGMILILCVSFGLVNFVGSVYKKLLHQTMSGQVTYSSREIAEYMQDMEELSMLLLADSNIQSCLEKIMKSDSQRIVDENMQKIRSIIGGYYQSYSDGILQYITIYSAKESACTNILRADKTPEESQQYMCQCAFEKGGAPIWITDYVKTDGLFLARRVNQISSIRKVSLGCIILEIDMEALIRHIVKNSSEYPQMDYIISSEGEVIYATKELVLNDQSWLAADKSSYSLIEINEEKYFVVRGSIEDYGWAYDCLVSYERIASQLKRMNIICVIAFLLGLMVVVFLTGRLVGNVTIHVNFLLDKMQRFGRDNTKVPMVNYDYSNRTDELGILHTQFDQMAMKTMDLIQRNYVNEILKQEAQYKALESQINPHFLYNTLESIKWRAKSIGEDNISDMVESLGILLRTSLKKQNDKDFSLGNEMEIVNSYITIQKIRYEERLVFQNLISKEYYIQTIPKLSIQPLVENAIAYGLETSIEECEILLTAQEKDGVLSIYVKNTGSEMEENVLEKLQREELVPKGHGIGLLNIDKRIKMIFGDSYGLLLYNEDEYAVACIRVPVNGGEKNAAINDC